MKQLTFLFLTLCVINISLGSTLFRIQIGTYKQRETPENIKEIPNLGNFQLPQNYVAIFSGGYYENYLGAKMRLNTVKTLGFSDAKLRVFRYGKLLDLLEGQKHIAKEELKLAEGKADETNINKQIYSLDRSASMENREILFNEISIPPPTEEELARITKEAQEDNSMVDNLKGKFVGFFSKTEDESSESESESAAIDDNDDTSDIPADEVAGNASENETPSQNKTEAIAEEPAAAEEKVEDEVIASASPAVEEEQVVAEEKEIQEEEEEEPVAQEEAIEVAKKDDDIDEEAHAMVEELIEEGTEQIDVDDPRIHSSGDMPFFKIYLGSNVKGGDTPESIENLPEIVYVYDKKKVIVYTVGYFGTSQEAENELKSYINQGFTKAKVVGIYRGIIISNEVAKAIVEKAR